MNVASFDDDNIMRKSNPSQSLMFPQSSGLSLVGYENVQR